MKKIKKPEIFGYGTMNYFSDPKVKDVIKALENTLKVGK